MDDAEGVILLVGRNGFDQCVAAAVTRERIQEAIEIFQIVVLPLPLDRAVGAELHEPGPGRVFRLGGLAHSPPAGGHESVTSAGFGDGGQKPVLVMFIRPGVDGGGPLDLTVGAELRGDTRRFPFGAQVVVLVEVMFLGSPIDVPDDYVPVVLSLEESTG